MYPVAHIDLTAIEHNFLRVRALAPNSQIMAVIKANAYGHGAVEAAKALSGSDAFAVARLTEAVQLRQAGISQPIVLLEGVHSIDELQAASTHNLSLVFHTSLQLDLLKSIDLPSQLSFCWLMMETGMHRLGFAESEMDNALSFLQENHNITGQIGIMSHFANSDEYDDERNTAQLERITSFSQAHDVPISLANSAAILSYPDSHKQWLRPGLMLYGISPFDDKNSAELGLRSVMRLCSQIIAIKELEQGDQVGYGGTWVAPDKVRIAIVDIGYGDGYSRQLSNQGSVLINGNICPVVGRVSMDMIAVDITSMDTVTVRNEVVLWGDGLLTAEMVAQKVNTIAYELVCQLNGRVRREYHYGES